MHTNMGPNECAYTLTDAHTYTHLIVSIMDPTDGRITKALVVKGQILPEDVSSANVKQN